MKARDPRREAQALVGDALGARVLEPSPPVPPGAPVVSPIPGAGRQAVDREPGLGEDPEDALPIDPASAALLADWFGFAHSVLEELRADPGSAGAGRVQIWPEHFDAAVDVVVRGVGAATFGASPGDAAVAEPYLYVLPPDPGAVARDAVWNAETFTGAILPLSGFAGAAEQRAVALAFLRGRRDARPTSP